MKRLEGKIALVTGAGSGIGKGIALQFAKEGATVLINDIQKPRAEEYSPTKKQKVEKQPHVGDAQATAAEIREQGGQAVVSYADVSDRDQVEKMVEDAYSTFGRLDIVVSNAYFSDRADFLMQVGPFCSKDDGLD
jgi:NAD(P)-dependent dehydrogenase (short-subunit alcohol dehydrogenase family)